MFRHNDNHITVEASNSFAEDWSSHNRRYKTQILIRDNRQWKLECKLDIPELHHGVRSEKLIESLMNLRTLTIKSKTLPATPSAMLPRG
ncbi:unnamed protein product [Arabis nemorensis]|uniref:Uncharacterized protein n=1 Tax=Arabis nemorensis TaxID=586526 RepID=A0A565AJQ0_9BRAS|nr:unnamed protein product [Arabis nemorensis]